MPRLTAREREDGRVIDWAGPVEFSTGQVVVLLLILAAYYLLPPLIGAFIGYQRYRRTTPQEAQTSGGAWRAAGLGAAIGIVVVVVGGWLVQAIGGF